MFCEEEDGRKEQDHIVFREDFGISSDESSTGCREVVVWTAVCFGREFKQGTHSTNCKSSNTMRVPWREHQDYL